MRLRVLTPDAAARLGGLTPDPHMRRSTPPSRAKAARYRMRQECAAIVREAVVVCAIAVPVAIAWVFCLAAHH